MMKAAETPRLSRIVEDLAEHGWTRQQGFLPEGLTLELARECRARAATGALAPAAVGRRAGQEVREGVRGDRIQWLEAGQSAACDAYLAHMDALRGALNEALYLGLADYECHFAAYAPGAFYERHLDRFRDDDRRTVTAVYYLNDGWRAEDGGALRLHFDDHVLDVPPEAGCLVVFLSDRLPHEVLPTHRERLSLTGWFRRRGEGVW